MVGSPQKASVLYASLVRQQKSESFRILTVEVRASTARVPTPRRFLQLADMPKFFNDLCGIAPNAIYVQVRTSDKKASGLRARKSAMKRLEIA
jgi:hypothetical protein